MSLTLYSHPFSSYCQKVLIALWEKELPFTYRHLEDSGANEERLAHWPLGQFPVLVDGDETIAESSIIIEHLDLYHPGQARFLPEDPKAALEVRFLDRFFDNFIMNMMQRAVNESLRSDPTRLEEALARTRESLTTAYAWIDKRLEGRSWAAGEDFTLADCAAAPSLFYADWVHQISDPDFPTLRAYRSRLLARPSFARAVEEARRYRSYFPLGAPDRD